MTKRLSAILSVVLGTILFLLGCSKSNHETLAFVGDESDMKTCYEIYPEDYFPNASISEEIRDGRFPPDIVGEYEINVEFVEGHYSWYKPSSQNYEDYPNSAYSKNKSVYIIIEEQVNGKAKIKFSTKKSGDYKKWNEVDAYIYGDVYSNKKDFVIYYEYTESAGEFSYIRGCMIKGAVENTGMSNIDMWSIIKGRAPDGDYPQIYSLYSRDQYHADFADKKN